MLIDEEDLGLLTQHKDGHWVFVVDRGYAAIRQTQKLCGDNRKVFLHRLIMDASVGLDVNHTNSNKLDNRKENLRFGKSVRGDSRLRGVSKSRNKWQASIWANSRNIYLGTFTTEIEAALAYDTAARLYDCEFRVLNFPNEVPNV